MPDTASLQAVAQEAQVRAEMARSRLIKAKIELAKREERFARSRAAGRLRIATEGNGGWDGQPSRGEGVHHRWERALPAAGSCSIARLAE